MSRHLSAPGSNIWHDGARQQCSECANQFPRPLPRRRKPDGRRGSPYPRSTPRLRHPDATDADGRLF